MTFEEIIPALRDGKRVKRRRWYYIEFLQCDGANLEMYVENTWIAYVLQKEDLDADDWGIVECAI